MTDRENSPKFSESARPRWQRIVGKLAATSLVGWFLRPNLNRLDRLVLRISRGRHTAATLLTGLPVIWLKTTGAHSGQERLTPVAGIYDGENYVLIASYLGSSRHPGWYYNIKSNPRLSISENGRTAEFTARELSGDERERCWNLAVQSYSGFEKYERRARSRRIPVIMCSPVGE